MNRRLFVATSLGAALAGCDRVTNALNENKSIRSVIELAEPLDHAVIGTRGFARTYSVSDITRNYPTNGLATPTYDPIYAKLMSGDFKGYALPVGGAVEHPQTLTLAQLRAFPEASQITRHDCVEGWSVVGQWAGIPGATILDLVSWKAMLSPAA